MQIGQIAAAAGVNAQTLRYYERRGLLDPPPRDENGYRVYPTDTVQLIRFIKRFQELGFSLVDVEDLLSLPTDPDPDSARELVREKLAGVRERLRDLQAMETALTHLLATPGSMSDAEELIVSALESDHQGTPTH